MGCKRMMRKPEIMAVAWPERLRVDPWTEDKSKAVGGFLHRVGAKLCSEYRDGTLESAVYYSLRAFGYQRAHDTPYLDTAQQASSLIFDLNSQELIAVCLVCGGKDLCGLYHLEVDPKYQRRGIARSMMTKALSTLLRQAYHQWTCGFVGDLRNFHSMRNSDSNSQEKRTRQNNWSCRRQSASADHWALPERKRC